VTKEETLELLKNCSEKLRPMVICAMNTGMRLGEILNLKWRDVDFENAIITVEHSKSGLSRRIPVNQQLWNTLRNLEKFSGCPYVFNHDGKRYTYVRKAFGNAVKKAGIETFRFHDLRHHFASNLAMAGVNLKAIQVLLGHKSFDMTLRYAHLSEENIGNMDCKTFKGCLGRRAEF
jgi:integrase